MCVEELCEVSEVNDNTEGSCLGSAVKHTGVYTRACEREARGVQRGLLAVRKKSGGWANERRPM